MDVDERADQVREADVRQHEHPSDEPERPRDRACAGPTEPAQTGGGGEDIPIPGEKFSFGVLCRAQAIGDYLSLVSRNRRLVSINLGSDVERGLQTLAETVKKVLVRVSSRA